MDSLNFEFLRPHNRELTDLGGFAECYVHSDPASALVKLRMFGDKALKPYQQTWQEYQLGSTPFFLIEHDLLIEGSATSGHGRYSCCSGMTIRSVTTQFKLKAGVS